MCDCGRSYTFSSLVECVSELGVADQVRTAAVPAFTARCAGAGVRDAAGPGPPHPHCRHQHARTGDGLDVDSRATTLLY